MAKSLVECAGMNDEEMEDYPEEDETSEEEVEPDEEDEEVEESAIPVRPVVQEAKSTSDLVKSMLSMSSDDAKDAWMELSFEEQLEVAKLISKKNLRLALNLVHSIELDDPKLQRQLKQLRTELGQLVPKEGSESHALKEAKSFDYDLSDLAKKKDVPVLKELLTAGVASLKSATDSLEQAQKKMLAIEPGKLSPELEEKISQYAMSVVDLKKQVIQAMQNMNTALKSVGSGISESKLNEEAEGGDFADIIPYLSDATVKNGVLIVTGKDKAEATSKISKAYSEAKKKNPKADTTFAFKHIKGEPYVIELRPA